MGHLEIDTPANGIMLHSRIYGSGSPLILLHGNSEDGTIFIESAKRLCGEFAVHLIDARGHGKSSRVPCLSYADMAEDVYAYIQAHSLNSVGICGFSDGGIVALLLAAMHPEVVSHLVVCGANLSTRGYTLPFRIGLWLAAIFKNSDYIRLMREMPDIPSASLRVAKMPALVLAGSRDIITKSHTKQLAAALPNAQCRILNGESHFSYVLDANKLCPLLRTFLTGY